MDREWRFAVDISVAHGTAHFFRRLLPPLVPVWVVVFEYPLWQLGVLLGSLTFGSAMGQAPIGVLSDRYDRRYILPAGMGVIGVGFVVFSVGPFLDVADVVVRVAGARVDGTFLVMAVSGFVAGVGTSALHPTGYPLITQNVSAERKGKVLGLWGSAAKFGDGLAPAAVGVLLLVVAWRQIVLVFGLLSVVYAGYLYYALGNFETRPGETVAAVADTSDPDGAVDVWADRRVYLYPLLAVFAFFAIRFLAAGGVNMFIPEFINRVYGYSVSAFGVSLGPESTASFYYSALLIAAGASQLLTGELVDRYDHRTVLVGLLGVAAVTLAVLGFVSLSPVVLFAVLVVLGASMWGINPARDSLISDITPADREGRTFGYIWTGALLVGAFSPVIVGYIGDVAGLQEAFKVLAVTTVVSAVPIVLLFSRHVYVNVDDRRSEATAD